MAVKLGIDIGGSGIKAAKVDLETGEVVSERHRIETPDRPTPDAVAGVCRELVEFHEWTGPVGIGFPGVVQSGVIRTAANLDKSWIDVDADALFTRVCKCEVSMVNDADAAGLAEVKFGAGADVAGTVILLTLGTGIGSAVFTDGKLVANTEFGHMEMDGKIAEDRASSRIKDEKDLSFKKWGGEVEDVLREVEKLFWPELFILGGGISKNFDEFSEYLDKVRTPVVPAQMLNRAGIVGAALACGAE